MPDFVFWLVLLLMVVAAVGMVWFERATEKFREGNRQMFQKQYPGRCYECWSVSHAKENGFLPADAAPRQHNCCEASDA